ncbi:hypothetical protein D3C72_2151220 [compost metagenome]
MLMFPMMLPVVPPAPICRMLPATTVVVPVKVLSPVRVSLRAPFCSRLPVPLMLPAKVVSALRLNTSAALLAMLPTMLPLSRISRVPALRVVPPV